MKRRERLRYWYDGSFLPWYTRWAPLAVGLCLAIATTAIVATYFTGRAQEAERTARVTALHSQLVTNCENANASRAASRALWGYIIDLSTVSNPHPTKHEQQVIDGFRDYVNAVYAPHDCMHLGKKYPLPKPPQVVAPKHHDR